MREVTKQMIKDFQIKENGLDFMGYKPHKKELLTFHHLIVANRNGGAYERWNGAILCGDTSHPYLHLIEAKEEDIFSYITSEMIDMNIKGSLDLYNLKRIHELLRWFEDRHKNDVTRKGRILIKDIYYNRPNLEDAPMIRVRKR